MRTPGMRSNSAKCQAAGWLCAAALLLMLAPTQAEEPPDQAPGQEDAASSGSQGDQGSSQEHADAEDPNEASHDDDKVSLEECACELAAGDGGCRSECNQSVDGKSPPNYCDGAAASAECRKCVQEKCGVELP